MKPDTFEVTSGAIHATDPCYDRTTWCAIWDIPAKNGTWHASVEAGEASGGWGYRIRSLSVFHESATEPADDAARRLGAWQQHDGEVGVDSGQAGIFDADPYPYPKGDDRGDPDDLDTFYGRCCACTLAVPQWGVVPEGVVTSSGFGDGSYPLHVQKDADGLVVAARITFIDDEEIEDDVA